MTRRGLPWLLVIAVVFLWAILRTYDAVPPFPGVDDKIVTAFGFVLLFFAVNRIQREVHAHRRTQAPPPPPAFVENRTVTELGSRLEVFSTLARVKRLTYYALLLPAVGVGAWLATAATAQSWWVPFFAAGIVYLFGWFFLIHSLYGIVGHLLWLARAKCPNCGTRFPRTMNVLPGHFDVDYVVPEQCTGCGCRFTTPRTP